MSSEDSVLVPGRAGHMPDGFRGLHVQVHDGIGDGPANVAVPAEGVDWTDLNTWREAAIAMADAYRDLRRYETQKES